MSDDDTTFHLSDLLSDNGMAQPIETTGEPKPDLTGVPLSTEELNALFPPAVPNMDVPDPDIDLTRPEAVEESKSRYPNRNAPKVPRKRRNRNGQSAELRDRLLAGETLTRKDLPQHLHKSLGNAVSSLRGRGINVDSRPVKPGSAQLCYSIPGAPDDLLTAKYYGRKAENGKTAPTKTPAPKKKYPKSAAGKAKDAARKRERAAMVRAEREAADHRAKVEAAADVPVPATVGDLLLGDRLRVTAMVLTDGLRVVTLSGPRGLMIQFEADDPERNNDE